MELINKVCSKCNNPKSESDFRVRHEKRKDKGDFFYLNNICRSCESELQKKYYKKNKNAQEFKLRNRKRVNEYRIQNRSVVLEKDKKRRAANQYKKTRKIYREKNKDKIYKQEKQCKLKYHKKNRDNLTDKYVVRLIISKTDLKNEDILKHPKLIEIKRKQIQILRKINERIVL